MVKKTNITQTVIQYLKGNIDDGTWTMGDKIPSENELTKILGVSRASVRTAIQQFIAIGVMESFHGKGTFIRSNNIDIFNHKVKITPNYDYSDIRKILEFRLIVEVQSMILALKNITKENLINLKYFLQGMKENVGNSEQFVKYDMLFHLELGKATGNHIIENSLKDFFLQEMQNHKELNEIFGYKDGIYYHTLILDALENNNSKKAKELMKEHIQKTMDELG